MARSKQQIQDSILSDIAASSTLSTELTSSSAVAIWRLWVNVMANALLTEEQLQDTFISQAETLIASNPPANLDWIKKKVYEFQYSATSPQVPQLNTDTLVYYYPTVDNTMKIITRASINSPYVNGAGVVVGTPGVVQVKVAKGTTPQALSAPELSAFQTYLNIIKPGGLAYKALSADADRLFCEVKIYYQGVYASVIKNNVYSAYLSYLANIPFDGLFKVVDLEIALRQVEGVNDVDIINCNYRTTTMSFSYAGCNIINNQTQLRKDSSGINLAGFISDENTTGYTFLVINDNNFVSE